MHIAFYTHYFGGSAEDKSVQFLHFLFKKRKSHDEHEQQPKISDVDGL